MSFFDDASLAFLPSGAAGKDGKAYSIKPTDGTGDFTFSRGSNLSATRISANGLIEKGRENLLTYSNNFGTTWGDDGGIIASGFEGYDGTNNAWKYTKTGQFDGTWQSGLSITGVHTISIYAKLPDGETDVNSLLFRIDYSGGNTNVVFSLTGDGVPSVGGNGIVADKINVGNGWFRCVLTLNQPTTKVNFRPSLGSSTSGTTGSIYIQDAQAEIGLAATEVIESGATTGKAGLLEDEPRFDYSGGATCPSLLLEPSRTNRCTLSEYFEGAGWLTIGSPTITTNYGTSPEGVQNSTRIVFSTSNECIYDGIAYTSEEVSTIYVKGTSGETIKFGKGANIFVGTLFTLDGTWQRLEFVQSVSGNTFTINTSGGATARDIEVWGAQNEEGSYPTSYIPNHSGGTITRGADDCTGAGDASTFNSTEGVLYFEGERLSLLGGKRTISISDGSVNNYLYIQFQGVSNTIRIFYKTIEFGQVLLLNHNLSNELGLNKYAFKWSNNNFSLWINGTKELEQLNGSTATSSVFSELNFALGNGFDDFYGNVKQVLTFNTALSDADLATLTTI